MIWVVATKTCFSCVFFDARLTAPVQLPDILTLQIAQSCRKQWLSSACSWSEAKTLNCGRKRWNHLSSLFSAKAVTGIFPIENQVLWLCPPGCSFLSQISRAEGSTADHPSKEQALTLGGLSSPKVISMVEMTKRWPWLWQAPPSQQGHSHGAQHQGLTWVPQPTPTRVFGFLNQSYTHSSTKVKPQQLHVQGPSWSRFLSQCRHCG